MDLRTHGRVIWRFRFLVAGGLVLATILTFFSYYRVSFNKGVHVGYRQSQTWQSAETILLTQPGFPWGYSNTPSSQTNAVTDPNWLTTLSSFYSQVSNSDLIRNRVRAKLHNLNGTYNVSPVLDASQSAVPFMEFDGLATSAGAAVSQARTATGAFLSYLTSNQNASSIPPKRRVVAQIVTTADLAQAKVISGRRLTIPIVLFLTVLIATLGLAYILENLRSRPPAAVELADETMVAPAGEGLTRVVPADEQNVEQLPAADGQRSRAGSATREVSGTRA
ncbi:MAG: hypothetical protein E6J20_18980 [Chloroflexi bacterium]|nr:MAG: hypothetical protein E6J20_18980 [Chloroflexota bacterium]